MKNQITSCHKSLHRRNNKLVIFLKESVIKQNNEPVTVLVQSLLISSLTEGRNGGVESVRADKKHCDRVRSNNQPVNYKLIGSSSSEVRRRPEVGAFTKNRIAAHQSNFGGE